MNIISRITFSKRYVTETTSLTAVHRSYGTWSVMKENHKWTFSHPWDAHDFYTSSLHFLNNTHLPSSSQITNLEATHLKALKNLANEWLTKTEKWVHIMKWAIEKTCRWENNLFSNVRQLSDVGHHLFWFFFLKYISVPIIIWS